ncbi:MAG: hypothetical protein HC906_14310, partial [Bacteroidales bacterium]|nr:hypothetical protein [Bacteroidales bacterium]
MPGTNAQLSLPASDTVYFRNASNHAYKQTLVTPGRLSPPSAYTIDYINEKTNENIPSTVEYATSSDMTGAVTGSSAKITVTPGQNLYFRTKATGSAFASSSIELTVPQKPAVPAFTVDVNTFYTSQIISSAYEYSTDLSNWITGSNASVAMNPGTTKYFRVKASASTFESDHQTLTAPAVDPPVYSIDFINQRTNENISIQDEFSYNQSSWSSGTGEKISLTPVSTIYFRKKADHSK